MIRTLLATLAALGLSSAAWAETAPATVTLMDGWRTDDGRHVAALRVDLAPGWKTYWRQPGAAGIPPNFDWSGSSNLVGAEWHWPVPKVFDQNGIHAVGYADQVILPVVLTPETEGRPIDVDLDVQIGVCQSICILYDTEVSGRLGDGTAGRGPIDAALSDRPLTPSEAHIGAVDCQVDPADRGVTLTTRFHLPAPLGDLERVAVEIPGSDLRIGGTETHREGDELVSRANIRPHGDSPLALDRGAIRFTLLSDHGAAEVTGCD